MAAAGKSPSGGGGGGGESSSSEGDKLLESFMAEVKAIEKKDSVWTSEQQINRLLRPGSTYFNLNPYEVLQITPEATLTEIKKIYRKLSILVHPDKNPDDNEKAQKAFAAVGKAYEALQDEEQVAFCKDIAEEAKKQLEARLDEKRKKAKSEGRSTIEEDDSEKYQQQLRNQITKMFADIEIKKKEIEEQEERDRKRQREEEEKLVENAKREKEWKTQWDSARNDRVDSWRSFQTKVKTKKVKSLRPPKLKQEKRTAQ